MLSRNEFQAYTILSPIPSPVSSFSDQFPYFPLTHYFPVADSVFFKELWFTKLLLICFYVYNVTSFQHVLHNGYRVFLPIIFYSSGRLPSKDQISCFSAFRHLLFSYYFSLYATYERNNTSPVPLSLTKLSLPYNSQINWPTRISQDFCPPKLRQIERPAANSTLTEKRYFHLRSVCLKKKREASKWGKVHPVTPDGLCPITESQQTGAHRKATGFSLTEQSHFHRISLSHEKKVAAMLCSITAHFS